MAVLLSMAPAAAQQASGMVAGESAPGQQAPDPDIRPPTAAESDDMAQLDREMRTAFDQNRLADAERAARALLALEQDTYGPGNPWTAGTLELLGRIAEEKGDAEAARDAYRSAHEIALARLGATDRMTRRLAEALGFIEFSIAMQTMQSGDWAGAEKPLRAALDLVDQVDPDGEMNLYASDALAMALTEQNREAESIPYRRNAFRLARQMVGPSDEMTLNLGDALAGALSRAGEREEAAKTYRVLAEAYEAEFGATDDRALTAKNNLAVEIARLDRHEEALSLADEVVRIREKKLGPTHPDTLVSYGNRAVSLAELGRHAEAAEMYRRVLDGRIATLGPEDPETLAAGDDLGASLLKLGRNREAVPVYERNVEIRTATLGPDDPATLNSRVRLAQAMVNAGRPADGVEMGRELVAHLTKVLGADDALTLTAMNNLAYGLDRLGRLREALAMHRDVLAARKRIFGPDNPVTLTSMAQVAGTLARLGEYAEAERIDRAVLAKREKLLGVDDPLTILSRSNLANDLMHGGKNREALALMEDAVRRSEAVLGPQHPQTAIAWFNLATAHYYTGDFAKAESNYRKALAIDMAVLGADDGRTLQAEANLAIALRALGRLDEAEILARKALGGYERLFGIDHPEVITTLDYLLLIVEDRGRRQEAAALARRAYEVSIRLLGEDHPDTLQRLMNLAYLLPRGEGEPLARKAVQMADRRLGAEHRIAINGKSNLATILDDLGRHDEAEEIERAVLANARTAFGDSHPTTARLANNLAISLENKGHYDEAIPLYEEAIATQEKTYGPEHSETLIAKSNLAGAYLRAGKPDASMRYAREALKGWRALQGASSVAHEETRAMRSAATSRAGWRVAMAASELVNDATGTRHTELVAEAFEAIQQRGLDGSAEAMAQAAARMAAGRSGLEPVVRQLESAREERENLDAAIAASVGEADAPDAVSKRAALSAARAGAQARIDAATEQLRAGFPRFFDMVMPEPLSFAELVGLDGHEPLLRESEALIILAPGPGEDDGFVFAVNREYATWWRIPLTTRQMADEIARLHAQLDGGSGTRAARALNRNKRAAFDRRASHALYDAIFGNPKVGEIIHGKSDWIIVPQGVLLSLPYNALVTEPPEGDDTDPAALRKTRWLGIEKAISVLPSLAMMRSRSDATARIADAGSAKFFGMADPDFAGNGEVLVADASLSLRDAGSRAEGVRQLATLPATRKEVLSLADLYGPERSTVYFGAEATEARLMADSRNGTLREASTLLFATHGLLSGTFDTLGEPALALTPPPEGAPMAEGEGWIGDGLLTASEASRLDLDADWVILSACDTAAGSDPDASGLTGLAQSFFYAGARSLLVSHWKVLDEVTARLTTTTVNRLLREPDIGRAQAFRAAMAEIIADESRDGSALAMSHPTVWAPFQVIGVE